MLTEESSSSSTVTFKMTTFGKFVTIDFLILFPFYASLCPPCWISLTGAHRTTIDSHTFELLTHEPSPLPCWSCAIQAIPLQKCWHSFYIVLDCIEK